MGTTLLQFINKTYALSSYPIELPTLYVLPK